MTLTLDPNQAHPLRRHLEAQLRAACDGDASLWARCEAAPADLPRLNPALLERVRRHAEPAAARVVAAAAARGGTTHAEEGGGDDDEELKFSEEVDGEGALMPREAVEAGDAADAADAEARPAPLAIAAAPGGQAAGGVPRSATAFAQYEALVPRLRLLRQLLWDGLLLQADVQADLQTASPRDLPLLHRSCVRHATGGADADMDDVADADGADGDLASPRRFWSSLEPCIFAGLDAIHRALLGWLATPPALRDGAEDGALLGALHAARLAHRAVWDFCAAADGTAAPPGTWAAVGLEPQGFLVLWRGLHKRLARLAALPAGLAAPAGLQAAC